MDENQEIEKKRVFSKLKFWGIIVFAIFLLGIAIWWLATPGPVTYSFVLDGQEYPAVTKCGAWNYDNLSAVQGGAIFIPCMFQNQTRVIFNQTINYGLSPQENCLLYNATFPGFNLKNDTKAKEIYDTVLPICSNIYADQINKTWLKENAGCVEFVCPPFYATPPHIPYSEVSCVKTYNVPLLKEAKEGFCTEWKTNDGLTILAK